MNAVNLWVVVVPLTEDVTKPEDYDPGWGLFVMVAFLVVAVVVLARSFRKQLRKADRHFGAAGDGSGRGGMIGDSDSAARGEGPDERPEDRP